MVSILRWVARLGMNLYGLSRTHALNFLRCLFYDKSLTPSELKTPDFKVSTIEYNVETESKWTAGDDTNYFYNLKENK